MSLLTHPRSERQNYIETRRDEKKEEEEEEEEEETTNESRHPSFGKVNGCIETSACLFHREECRMIKEISSATEAEAEAKKKENKIKLQFRLVVTMQYDQLPAASCVYFQSLL